MNQRNVAASVRARLLNKARAEKLDFNLLLTRYALERVLYRLSISEQSGQFLLKGALLFDIWFDVPHRPTHDADLLGFGSTEIPHLEKLFREVSQIAVEDGIAFQADTVKAAEIRKEANYAGVRVTLLGLLDNARCPVQIDIGFGDAVTPAPENVQYPVILDGMPQPQLRVYPRYTVVAEKLEAMVKLGILNSRLKDYFDLWVLLTEEDLAPDELRRAVEATFARRRLAMPADLPIGLSDAFAQDPIKQRQWAAFFKKNGLAPRELAEVVARLRDVFLALQSA